MDKQAYFKMMKTASDWKQLALTAGAGVSGGAAVYSLARLLGLKRISAFGLAIPAGVATGYGAHKLNQAMVNEATAKVKNQHQRQYSELYKQLQNLGGKFGVKNSPAKKSFNQLFSDTSSAILNSRQHPQWIPLTEDDKYIIKSYFYGKRNYLTDKIFQADKQLSRLLNTPVYLGVQQTSED